MKPTNLIPISQHNAQMLTLEATICQLMSDIAEISAHKLFGFGDERCAALIEEMGRNYSIFSKIYREDAKDKQYTKAALDAALREIHGDRLIPCDKRYST